MSTRDPSPSGRAQHSDSGRSRSGRSGDEEGSESSVELDLVFLPGRRRGRRYRGVGRPGIRGRGRGRGRTRGAGTGAGTGASTGDGTGVGRGRGQGRGRGRGRGSGSGRAGDSLTDRQREVLVEGWAKQDNVFADYPFRGGTPGPTTPSAGESAGACFGRFFTEEVWDLLVRETNRFAAQVRAELTSSSPRPWHDVDKDEMKAFVGVMMVMGICKLPRLEMYWSTTHPLFTPELRKVMSLKRFQQIWRFFHLNDSNKQVPHGQLGYDPLFKVRTLLDLVSPRLESEYNPHEQLSVDEAMIKFKGRLGFKQYMKAKPTKWGIKVFVLSDSTNGYVHRFQVYTGKNSSLSGSGEHGLCTQAVLSLMQGIEDRCHKVFMDNYYTSPILFLTLYDKKVQACGTAKTYRKWYPQELAVSDRGKERGWYDYQASPPLLACAWKDRRIINFLTTMHKATGPTRVLRTVVSDGRVTREAVTCPPLLPDYQAFMRGVDRADQLIGYYNIGRRSKKWWKRVFGYVIEVAALNAYIIQKEGRPTSDRSKHDYLDFRVALAEELIGTFSSRQVPAGRPRSVDHQQTLRLDPSKGHLPIVEDSVHDCVVCCKIREVRKLKRSELRHETKYKCSVCDVNLCLSRGRNCFMKYHTSVRYWE